MLKFFRKIRHSLIVEKKLGNYLLYALGEIILVVIGILIALSIDNANQEHILREKEHVYLVGLKNEFMANKNKLHTLIEVNKRNYESAKAILNMLDNENDQPNEQELSQLLFEAFAFEIAYNPNNSLLNEMMNSGSLKDISSTALRLYLTSWNSMIDNIKIQEADLRKQRENVRDMLRSDQASLRTILDHANITVETIGLPLSNKRYSNLELLKSKEFENNALSFILTGISTETSHYVPLVNEIDEILKLLDQELQ
ncbi:DUF6090 family protein [Maribacter confluentis]|uniref:DUF6090 family protein n=1 Tax=Maribacter confluentis TaxID=1656093 RepID=A0ABT8RR22_9FLAO|nr:DUF6090 family protein [Maribacter confluentis]MDO1513395.1 DUF6090 family protein [Maribacter confluentis]